MNDRLRADLEYGADTIPIAPGDLDRVKTRARRRDQRHRRVVGATAAVALVAGTLGVFQLGDDSGGEATVATEGGAPAQLGDAGIVWERVADPSSALGGYQTQSPVSFGGQLYALSTAPGERSNDRATPRVLWSSTDGVEWTSSGAPDELYLMDLAAAGDRLYAVGTGPATAAVSAGRPVHEVVVGTSTDGRDWDSTRLPLDLAGMAGQASGLWVGGTEVATTGDHTVAFVSVHAEPDVPALLPEGVEAPHGWAVDADGVHVLGDGPACPEGSSPTPPDDGGPKRLAADPEAEPPGRVYSTTCWDGAGDAREVLPAESHGIVASYPWDDLGVSPDLRQAMLDEPFVFAGTDGRFEQVRLPEGLYPAGGQLQVIDGQFVYVATAPHRITGGGPGNELKVLRSTDGRTWTPDPTGPGRLTYASAVGTVDGNIAVVGMDERGGPVYAELHDGGWEVTAIADLLGVPMTDDSGAWVSAASMGPLGVVLGVGTSDADGDPTHSILASRDGRTWDVQPLEELAGERVRNISQIAVTDDRAAVSVAVGPGDGMGLSRIVAIVGTPR